MNQSKKCSRCKIIKLLSEFYNDKGYILDNVVPCCHRCNSIKSNYFTYEDIIKLSPLLIEIRLSKEKRS